MVVNVDNLMLITVEGPHYHRWVSTDMDAVMLAQEVPVSSRHHIQKLNFEVITILLPVSVAYICISFWMYQAFSRPVLLSVGACVHTPVHISTAQ